MQLIPGAPRVIEKLPSLSANADSPGSCAVVFEDVSAWFKTGSREVANVCRPWRNESGARRCPERKFISPGVGGVARNLPQQNAAVVAVQFTQVVYRQDVTFIGN
jgi:hypothetical protein